MVNPCPIRGLVLSLAFVVLSLPNLEAQEDPRLVLERKKTEQINLEQNRILIQEIRLEIEEIKRRTADPQVHHKAEKLWENWAQKLNYLCPNIPPTDLLTTDIVALEQWIIDFAQTEVPHFRVLIQSLLKNLKS
jgi:hypothetical protein